ncbi:MAG: PAS domain S-box protein [Desulfobacteraceae bacterium]|nr:PAS domain S-box protein [Desulfobacteraceae bacterium]
MMMKFRNLSIKKKIIGIIISSTLVAIFLGFGVVIINDIRIFKEDMHDNALISAQLIGDYLVSPLVFEDKNGAEEMLARLEGMHAVDNGVLYDDKGLPFASFSRNGQVIETPIPTNVTFGKFEGNFLNLYHPVTFQNKRYGTLYLRFSTALLHEKIETYLVTMICLMAVLVIMSYWLASRFQRVISRPILELAQVTGQVSKGADYSIRVQKIGDDEIGVLYDGFNNMLKQIRLREAERDKAENELRKFAEEMKRLRNLLTNIIDSMPSVLVGIDPEGRVTQWNREACRVTGLTQEKAQGHMLPEVFPLMAGEMERVRQAIVSREVQRDATVAVQVDGERRFSDITVYPLISDSVDGAVIRIDDVTERVLMEEMMVQSEKMFSVGGLAAGMAHEINNPLAGVLQNTQNALRRLTQSSPVNDQAAKECGTSIESIKAFIDKRGILRMLEAVRNSGKRAAVIVDNMLSFSRKSESHFLSHNIRDLLDKTLNLASSDYDLKKKYDFRQIEILREYEPELPMVYCEGSKIQQVILNLLKNAAQAMAEGKESMMKDGRARRPLIILRAKKEGKMLRIEVEDNGPGMPEAVRKRVFEPFFTTKGVGQGTGLGLSVSYFIITENHNGTMTLESMPGSGSKFVIRLPLERST